MQKLSRPKSMTVETTNRLREAILEGKLHLGARLSEQRLANALGVSRSPVSDALTILATEGLIDIVPKRGSFVFLPDAAAVAELCSYRAILEVAALDLAMQNKAEILLSAMQNACSMMEEAIRSERRDLYTAGDIAFHESIVANCGNNYLFSDYRRNIGPVMAIRSHVFRVLEQETSRSMRQHLEIRTACEFGKRAEASALLRAHIGHLANAFQAMQAENSDGLPKPDSIPYQLTRTAPGG